MSETSYTYRGWLIAKTYFGHGIRPLWLIFPPDPDISKYEAARLTLKEAREYVRERTSGNGDASNRPAA